MTPRLRSGQVPARAVVFDFDGVLADTEGLHLAAYQDVFAPRGWTLDRETYFDRYFGYDDHNLIRVFIGEHAPEALGELDGLIAEKARRFEVRLALGQVLFPTAMSAVHRLSAGYRLAIASGSFREEILKILAANKLTSAFEVIVGCDDVAKTKPEPDCYLKAVHDLGVEPGHALAIEDSPFGLAAARAAGLKTIGITTSCAAAVLARADRVVTSLDDVTPELIRTLFDMR